MSGFLCYRFDLSIGAYDVARCLAISSCYQVRLGQLLELSACSTATADEVASCARALSITKLTGPRY